MELTVPSNTKNAKNIKIKNGNHEYLRNIFSDYYKSNSRKIAFHCKKFPTKSNRNQPSNQSFIEKQVIPQKVLIHLPFDYKMKNMLDRS